VLVGLSVGRASQWQFSQVPGFLPNTELYPKRNETFRSYHADAASDSWQRALAFFAERMGRTSPTPTSGP